MLRRGSYQDKHHTGLQIQCGLRAQYGYPQWLDWQRREQVAWRLMRGLGIALARDCPHCSLDSRTQAEFAQDMFDVHLHRAFGNVQVTGDELVRQTDRDPLKNALLLFRQAGFRDRPRPALIAQGLGH